MSYVHDAAVDWARRALREEFHDVAVMGIDTAAQIFVAVAEDYDVPIEELIRWIHDPTRKEELTSSNWVRNCIEYTGLRARLGCKP